MDSLATFPYDAAYWTGDSPMPKLDYHVPVDASLQTIWNVLLDRIEHPDRYLAGVESFSFPESEADYAVREVNIQGMTLRERITIDERQGEIRYALLEHPLFAGDVYNALIPPAEDDPKAKPVVQFRMDWQPLNAEAKVVEADSADVLEESLRQAVGYVRDLAEHLEKQEVG
jgi:hypothetical protein